MAIFDKKIKKTWALKVNGTESAKSRYEKIIEGLAEVDPDLSFKIENLLEEQLEQIIIKGEKELKKLQEPVKEPEKSSA